MGWLDGWWRRDDPLDQLDPSLKAYLESQTPKNYRTGEVEKAGDQTYREQIGLKGHTSPSSQPIDGHRTDSSESIPHGGHQQAAVPTQSLYQDGRYAHLWKSYRAQNDIEEAGKSDQEKLTDVVGAFKEQQAEVGRAAIENCADEQWAVSDCFRNGSWASRATMCKEENRSLSRCITMQTRFLKALGYASMTARAPEEMEKIQMHADTLYHRMLDYEKDRDEAQAKGVPGPQDPNILHEIDSSNLPPAKIVAETGPSRLTFEQLPLDVQKKLTEDHLKDLEGMELELAKRQLNNTIAINQDLVTKVQDRYQAEYKERMKRLEEGQERFGDKIKRWFDLRKYADEESKKTET